MSQNENDRPNVVIILVDDMGYSDIGCFGGEIETPNIDSLAADGVALSQFYNTARCSPSRASLLTGLHPHQTGVGILNYDDSPEGYPGNLNTNCLTIAEALRPSGYRSYISGKWHVASDIHAPSESWPTRRGFDRFFGTLEGAGSYFQPRTLTRDEQNVEHESSDPDFYYTDAISEHATQFLADHAATHPAEPFFLYVAYTAPHWPLHARQEDIDKYQGRFQAGWDALRDERMARLRAAGTIGHDLRPSGRDHRVPSWEEADSHEWEASRMAVYAAQIDRMDQGIGQVLAKLDEIGARDNTLVMFLSDNGSDPSAIPVETAEDFVRLYVRYDDTTRDGRPVRLGSSPEVTPGSEDTYSGYGRGWANLSNTPFREYKTLIHEGGISTPLLARWPRKLPAGVLRHQPHQLIDIAPTVFAAAGLTEPPTVPNRTPLPAPGVSMLDTMLLNLESSDRVLYWEHEGNCGVRKGPWKLVRKFRHPWELYNMDSDRTELNDLSGIHPELVQDLATTYERWATESGVIPREHVLELFERRGYAGRVPD
ncbi:MAG: arylsulfatase [Leucobacter sp.]|nr:arylsulfatase [Leucobacter sp.]